jgi:hypothetical protein
MLYHTYRDVLSLLWYAILLDARLPNVYGQGSTEEESVISLRIRLHQLGV